MIEINVNTTRPYKVISERGIADFAGEHMARIFPPYSSGGRKVCLVCDDNVYALYGMPAFPLQTSLREAGFSVCEFVFRAGEESKSITTLEGLLLLLGEKGFGRGDIVLALGGGVTGDLGGFAAAIYMRGISYVQMPTTLLAAADSSVGGKTAVNMPAGKNLVGAFWQPSLVMFDPAFIETLPEQELLSGLTEIIKMGFIRDGSVLDAISEGLDVAAMKAVEIKKEIVEEDEREEGLRKLLNLGHTVGHAIEKCSNYRIPHGIAVMTGMYVTSLAADELHWSEEAVAGCLEQVIGAFGYPVITEYSAQELTAAALSDKKRFGENITIVYPDRPGHSTMKDIPLSQLEAFIACGLETARNFDGPGRLEETGSCEDPGRLEEARKINGN